jgi:hypothetical protein
MIDPSIPLQGKPPQIPNPMDAMGKMIGMQNAQQGLQENAIKLQQMKQSIKDEQAVRDILAQDQNLSTAIPKIYKAVGANAPAYLKSMIDQQHSLVTMNAEQMKATRDNLQVFSDAIDQISGLPKEYRDAAYKTKIQNLMQSGLMTPEMIQHLPPEWDDELSMLQGNYLKQQMAEYDQKLKGLQFQEATNKAAISKQVAANTVGGVSPDTRFQAENRQKSFEELTYEDWIKEPENRGKNRSQFLEWKGQHTAAAVINTDDPKDIAQAVMEGREPPDLTGFYRNKSAIVGELSRAGYNRSLAQLDFKAIEKHLATLNGAQQERLRQAVTFTYDSLDVVESLYDDWKKTGLPGGFKIWNKAALAAAAQMPGETGAKAQALQSQINDLISELGTVYKGGNASTDESLKLAGENLKGEWNDVTFKKALQLVRKNLQIRKNSIMSSSAAGVREGSPYATAPGTQVGPTPGTVVDGYEFKGGNPNDAKNWIKK